ncbi:VWA domain-containing protein [Erythrobacter sp. SDW2]|uniref:VWA domain-containing protein n=1 Tax=Erythrobacter sp. SDW2 TaxID=2907154 RepID=UPI001F395238|nr:VWA domain-containing protein [Erythrobacter sp. SDW2]UIP06914.1 VWA domain-containing protein [Erythrobacter sp. SDW2]
MSEAPVLDPGLADAILATSLFLKGPLRFGGIVLRGFGPARDVLVDQVVARLAVARPVAKLPINADAELMAGGIDLPATLASGTRILRPGLLERLAGGVLLVPMAERLEPGIAAQLAQAVDRGELALLLLDDGIEPDEAPPPALLERAAFHCDLTRADTLEFAVEAGAAASVRAPTGRQRKALAGSAAALGIASIRPVLFAEQAARHHAAFRGAGKIEDGDLAAAVRLVLAPRATRMPKEPDQASPPPQPESALDESGESSTPPPSPEDLPLEDLLLAAAAASIPPHVLDLMQQGALREGRGQAGRSGQKQKSARRGRPLGSRPGMPGQGRRLALVDTLRAAAPWQGLRRAMAGGNDTGRLHIRTDDLHIRRFEQRRESLTIFVVDASGSSALARLAEAKGAVELMLAQAHVKRSQVALIAFRKSGAEVLLAPTRSLTRARRALGALPGGGGTPLAAGLREALVMADSAQKRGLTPTIALLTDGKANVTLDGEADRPRAAAEVEQWARAIALSGHLSVVIDIAPRPREEAAALAAVLRGTYLALPHARSAAMVEAIETVASAQGR